MAFLILRAQSPLRPAAAADAIKGEVSTIIENGFGRLLFTLAEDVESQVRLTNGIVVITFKRPVNIAVDKLSASAPGYISAARRDPDGKAIRIALAGKMTMNAMAVPERLFVDLLPETWNGLPPGLPREVIEDLARRAREGEKKLRQQRSLAQQNQMIPIRVRVANQPTFTRYTFELPEQIGVVANRDKERLTLAFDTLLKFDLADAKATLPPMIGAIESEIDQDTAMVRFTFAGKVDVRTFREDLSYVVDVTSMQQRNVRQGGTVRSDELAALAADGAGSKAAPPTGVEPPQTVPVQAGAAADAGRAPEQSTANDATRNGPGAQPNLPAGAPAQAATAPSPAPSVAVPMPAATPAAVQDSPSDPPPQAAPGVPPVPARPDKAEGAKAESGKAVRDFSYNVNVTLKRHGDNLSLQFPFAHPTPAAMFLRADTLWLVFDTNATIGFAAVEGEPSRTIKSATLTRHDDIAVLRIKLARPRLVSAATEGPGWTVTIGAEVLEPTRALGISRTVIGPMRSSITIPFDDPRQAHRLADPEAGDTLLVVTALGPARGFIKTQDFVELRALASTHGVVVQPHADDLDAELAVDKIVITRPQGLVLSATLNVGPRSASVVYLPHVLDAQVWTFDRQADFGERKSQLIRAAADAKDRKRHIARVDLARFYLARDMATEAKAVLDVALADSPPTAEDPTPLMLRAVAQIMSGRPEQGLKDLANPFVGNQHDAPLWRALAYARQGKWADAREGFRNVGMALGTLPLEIQRTMLKEMMRAAIEVGDITGAINQMHEFETVGIPHELEPALSVLNGRLAEGLGRVDDALSAYRAAADSWDRPVAAQGHLREVVLKRAIGNLSRADAIAELETLTTIWRGDETEVEALQLLARIYTEDGRYRDAFHIMRAALAAHPNSEITRHIHEEAAETFESLYLAGKADALPAVEALSLFYDFRDLTPIGRRGDEMIRRLADRLVAVDLLDQAAELLQHQVDHRLQGAARAQVATRLAVIYLTNRKPDRTLATLRATRTAELSNELRNQRLLIEARALSELGRHDLALEVVANIEGREVVRLRSDIMWAARRWRDAAEQIELLYSERWKEFDPFSAPERTDLLRAAIGFALGEDSIGLLRFREKFAGKMGDGPDQRAFDVVTAPIGTSGAEFRDIARAISMVDTLDSFLRDMRARYPESGEASAAQQRSQTAPAPPAKPEPATTGTIAPRLPPVGAARPPAGRSAAR